jgi:hypothetical protein
MLDWIRRVKAIKSDNIIVLLTNTGDPENGLLLLEGDTMLETMLLLLLETGQEEG